jgi:hypothetical protein
VEDPPPAPRPTGLCPEPGQEGILSATPIPATDSAFQP